MARGLLDIISVSTITAVPTRYSVTVSNAPAELAIGDHIGARTSSGAGSLYLLLAKTDSTLTIEDSLTEAEPGEFGAPAIGSAAFGTSESSFDLTQLPFDAPGWDAMIRRNASIIDSNLTDSMNVVLRDGSLELTANWDVGPFEVRAATFQSDILTGTAPFIVASTTRVDNLNADLLDGQHDSFYLDFANFTGETALITGGTSEIDGDKLDIDWDPSNYIPDTIPTEVDNVDNLTAHLFGIDAALGNLTIGSDVQAWDADLDAIAALSPSKGNLIVGESVTASWNILSTGSNNQILVVDSTESLGMKWADSSVLSIPDLCGDPDITLKTGATDCVPRWRIDETGDFLAVDDNAYDIGSEAGTDPGVNRPRRVYVGTELVVGDGTVRIDNNSILASDGLTIQATGTGDDITIQADVVTINGDLTVNGAVISDLIIEDRLVLLADGVSSQVRSGLAIERGSSGDDAILYFNTSPARFELGLFDTAGGTAIPSGSLTSLADLRIEDLSLAGTDIAADGSLTITAGAGSLTLETTGADAVQFSTSSTPRWTIGSTGGLLANTDGGVDIGATGANRPGSIFVDVTLEVGDENDTGTIRAPNAVSVDTAGGSLEVRSGDGNGAGIGGDLEIRSGQGTANGIIQFTVGLTNRWNINTNGHILANSDNTIDIGSPDGGTTDNRPRTIYVGTEIVIGDTINIDNNSILASNGLTIETTGTNDDLTITVDGESIFWSDDSNRLLDGSFTATSVIGALNELKTSPSGDHSVSDAATSTSSEVVSLTHTTSGTAAAGFGEYMSFVLEDSGGNADEAARFEVVWKELTAGDEDADIVFSHLRDGVISEGLRIGRSGGAGSSDGVRVGIGINPATTTTPTRTLQVHQETSSDTILTVLDLTSANSAAAGGAGLGVKMTLSMENSIDGSAHIASGIRSIWTNSFNTNETADLILSTFSGGSETDLLFLDGSESAVYLPQGELQLSEISEPGTPPTNRGSLWADTSGDLHWKNDGGIDFNLSTIILNEYSSNQTLTEERRQYVGLNTSATNPDFTITLPPSPTEGDRVWLKDQGGAAATNNVSIDGNGNAIDGLVTEGFTIDQDDQALMLIFTFGEWRIF